MKLYPLVLFMGRRVTKDDNKWCVCLLDPSPWLEVTPDLREKLKAKPYDPKRSCWVPNKVTNGFDEGLIEACSGDKVTVRITETKEVSPSTYLYKILGQFM